MLMGRKRSACPSAPHTRACLIALFALCVISADVAMATETEAPPLGLSSSLESPLVATEPGKATGLSSDVPLPDTSDKGVAEVPPAKGFAFAPVPDWVRPTPAFDPNLEPVSEAIQGYHGRLKDFQYNGVEPGKSSYFNALEYRLTNRYGVENYSSIEISFDPGYEQLYLHELWIKRGDTLMDKLPTARFDLLRTEADRAELIYDGTRTLAIVLDDVRTGDTVRYSYTVNGENPIYHGNREFRVHTELWSPLDRQYTRVLTSSDRPFSRRVRGEDMPLQITDENGIQELVLDQRGVPEFTLEDDVPSWYYNRGTLVFSDMKDWRAVVDWAAPMYQLQGVDSPEVRTIASVIRASTDDLDEQIGAALRWVQEEIRYFGVELGKNSHWPSRPAETLARRFGDCKDKALLLMALLTELGVDARAALVNTDRGLESSSFPYRLHAFNHVIVQVVVDNQVHFIDPTLRNQAGALGVLREPDYGRALVLADDTTGLSEMPSPHIRYRMSVNKTLDLTGAASGHARLSPDSGAQQGQGTLGDTAETISMIPSDEMSTAVPATLEVSTRKLGSWAESLRYSLESDGARNLGEAYKAYYADYFDNIVATEEPEFMEAEGNSMIVNETYRIPDFWLNDGDGRRYRWINADEIIGYLDLPERTSGRQQPYEIVHPILIKESWDVKLPNRMRLEDLDESIVTQWMRFSKTAEVSEDGTMVNVRFRYQTLSNEVAAEDLTEYAAAVNRIHDMASFYIEDEPSIESAVEVAGSQVSDIGLLHWWLLLPGLALLLVRTSSTRFMRKPLLAWQ